MEFMDFLTRGWVTVRRLWRQDPEDVPEIAVPPQQAEEHPAGIPLVKKLERYKWAKRMRARRREYFKMGWPRIPRCAIALRPWSPEFYRRRKNARHMPRVHGGDGEGQRRGNHSTMHCSAGVSYSAACPTGARQNQP